VRSLELVDDLLELAAAHLKVGVEVKGGAGGRENDLIARVSGGSGQLTFLHAREAARRAALYLYGEGSTGWGWDSPASRAVENAFGAVNVGLNYGEREIDLAAKIAEIKKRLSDLDFSHLAPPEDSVPFKIVSDEERERAAYMAGVEKIRERISK
jgi:hypothetical protein